MFSKDARYFTLSGFEGNYRLSTIHDALLSQKCWNLTSWDSTIHNLPCAFMKTALTNLTIRPLGLIMNYINMTWGSVSSTQKCPLEGYIQSTFQSLYLITFTSICTSTWVNSVCHLWLKCKNIKIVLKYSTSIHFTLLHSITRQITVSTDVKVGLYCMCVYLREHSEFPLLHRGVKK